MKLNVNFTKEQIDELKNEAIKNNQTLTELVTSRLFPDNKSLINKLTLNEVIARAENLSTNERFTVKSLFNKEEWINFENRQRLLVGRSFFKVVNENVNNINEKIEFIGKDCSRIAIYQRK